MNTTVKEAIELQEEAKRSFFWALLIEALIKYNEEVEHKEFSFEKSGFKFMFEDLCCTTLTFSLKVSFNGRASQGMVVSWPCHRSARGIAGEISDNLYREIH